MKHCLLMIFSLKHTALAVVSITDTDAEIIE
jgi:hypothetical protein